MTQTPRPQTPLVITGAGLVLPDAGDAIRYVSSSARPPRFSARALRRVSRLGQLALPAVEAAWTQAQLEPGAQVGLVVGTALADLQETAAFLRTLHERGPKLASPLHFQRSVHGALAGELAILYGLTGYNLTVTDGLQSGATALHAASTAIRAGRCRHCLVVGCDTLTAEFLLARGHLFPDKPVGEAAAALVLEQRATASKRGAACVLALPDGPHNASSPMTDVGYTGAEDLLRLAQTALGMG